MEKFRELNSAAMDDLVERRRDRWMNVRHLGRRGPVSDVGLGSPGEPCDPIRAGEHGENFSEFQHRELTIVRFVPSLGVPRVRSGPGTSRETMRRS